MLLDTSGLLCYYHKGEPQHADAVEHFETSTVRLTPNYVLAEFIPLCQTRGLNRRKVLEFAADLLENPGVDVVWVDEQMHRSAMSRLEARPDKEYSLCDAVSFVLMRAHGMYEALTTDHHFQQEGFVRLLTP